MTSTKLTFDQANQERTIDIFASSDYKKRYFRLCDSFQEDGDINGPRLNLARTADIFRNAGIQVQLDKRFKVFTFDPQEAAGWTWHGKLVVQKHDNLEPTFEGNRQRHAIGFTLLGLADRAGDRRTPPLPTAASFTTLPEPSPL